MMLSFRKHFLFFVLATLFALEQVKAYSITFQSVTCNVLSASITLESWEYLQGSYIQLYTDTQSASTSANSWYFQMGLSNRYTSSSLTNQVIFINNRFAFFAGKSSVAIGIADSIGNLLPYQGYGDPDIATLNFSPPQGCGSTIVSSTSSSSPIFTSTSSLSTITRSSSSTSTSSTSPINRFTTTTTSPIPYPPTPTPDPIYDDVKHTNTGAIAGGVVGGVIVLILLILLAFCIRRRKKDENNDSHIAPLGFTQSNSNRGSNFTQPDIEKDPQSITQHDKSIEECEVIVLGKDDHSEPMQNNRDYIPNDPEFTESTNQGSTINDTTSSIPQPKAEQPLMPENPLLKHLNKMNVK